MKDKRVALTMHKILIVDDDPNILKLIGVILQEEGFSIVTASDGVEAVTKLETIKVNLVILDVMMPNMNGWELCKELRKYYDIPILMLTVNGETDEKVKGFQVGTDDYLVKPFDRRELVARVYALLKRYQITASKIIQVGELFMNRSTYEVKIDNNLVTLPLKEFELLYKLASFPGKTFSRDQLIEDIWGYDYKGNERTLDVHVNRLRERLSTGKQSFKITTIRGLGYRIEVVS
jgi:DNA-binding response OmpR family regulator